MWLRRSSSVALAVLAASCAGYLRPPKPDQHEVFKAEAIRFTSSNGFRFIVLPDPQASVVRLDVRYHVGAMQDPPGKEGLAHLVEHLLFQTTLKTSSGELTVAQIHGGIAQWSNAFTTLDSTQYMVQVAPEHLATAFALEIGRLRAGCATWDEATFAREREIVRNEIRRDHVDAWGDVPRLLHEAAYPAGHPYRRTTGGTDVSLTRLTRADACAFVARHYRPGNLTIVASGATSENEIKQLASQHLTAFPPTQLQPAPQVAAAPQGHGQLVRHELDIDEPVLVGLFPLPAEGTRARRLVDIASAGIEGELAELVARNDWGHAPSVAIVGGARAPLLAVSVTMRGRGEVGTARSAIATSMRRATNQTRFIDDERWRNPAWLWRKEGLIAAFEEFGSRPAMFADFEQFDDEPLYLIGRLRELDQVRSDEIHRAGERYLDPEEGTYVLFTPRRGARGSSASGFSYRATAHDADGWRTPVDVAEADRPLELPRNRVRTLPVVERRLDNGLRVLMWPHGTTPLVYGRLVVAAGSADDPAGKSGLAGVTGGMVGPDVTESTWRELSVDMDLLVEQLSYFLRHGQTQDLDRWREQAARDLKLAHTAERAGYVTALRAALYGAEHPYGRGVLTPATLRNIDGDAVAAFERTWHTAGNSTLILSGKLDPELAFRHVRFQYGHLASKARAPRAIPPVAPRTAAAVVAIPTDRESPVLEVDVAWTAPAGIDDSYAARLVLARVIGARLLALREGLAVSYDMSADYTPRIGPGEWRITGTVDAARAADAMAALERVLDELRADPASWKGDFVLARRRAVDDRMAAGTSASVIARQLAFVAAFELPLDFHDRLLDQLAAVRPADLQRIIATELTRERAVVGLFGPAAAVDAAAAAVKAGR